MPMDDLSWRTQNIGRVLFSASYVFVQDELQAVDAGARVGLTQAQMALFQNLDAEPTGLTQIATRAKMTKQAMLELVDKAEQLGLVYRRTNPGDRRTKHVALTPSGAEVLDRLAEGEAAAEARLAQVVGPHFVEMLRTQLRCYIDGVGAQGDAQPAPGLSNNSRWRTDHLGRVLHRATNVFVGEAMRLVRQAGLEDVRDVHMALYRNLDLTGTRLTVVAERAQMTKQAMRELVGKTEALGFVERLPDPLDGRAKIIRFTPDGLRMLGHVKTAILRAEATLEQITGQCFVREAKRRLKAYLDAADPKHLTGVDHG